jgi:methyl-accepting chemotaxis protein
MIDWFEKRAPIRLKFKALLGVYSLLAAIMAGAACYAASHAVGIDAALVMGIAIGAAVAVAGVTIVASRLICTPYVNTVLRMEALVRGDLDSPVAYTNHRDCVGRMTKAMEHFRGDALAAAECNTQRAMALAMGEGLEQVAGGNLTYRITAELSGPFAKLKDNFNAATTALERAMGSVTSVAHGIHQGAGDIQSASDDMSRRTEQQAASLEQTAAAMDEITTTVRKTAADAVRANAIVSGARSDAEEGGEVVRRAVGAMSDIERSSTEISEIIGVIDGIAFQTNLLALNAGVEAARAGDAGKGFAVVASEVRALAQRSADAAKDVKTRITRSSEQVGIGVGLVHDSGKSLRRIIDRVGELGDVMTAITAAAEHQATGLQQVNTAVADMDQVTQQNAAMVEQSTAASRCLLGEADELKKAVARFTVGETVDVAPGQGAVHRLERRPAVAVAQLRTVSSRGGAAVAAQDDWSEF